MKSKTVDQNEIRLVKYSQLIDRAIAEKKYGLAHGLAYRCLLEYNRLFIRFCIPNRKLSTQNAFLLTVEVVRYLRKHTRRIQFRRSLQLLRMLRTSYYLTSITPYLNADHNIQIDRAMAIFSRDQALSIARFLMGSLPKYRTKT